MAPASLSWLRTWVSRLLKPLVPPSEPEVPANDGAPDGEEEVVTDPDTTENPATADPVETVNDPDPEVTPGGGEPETVEDPVTEPTG